MRRQRLAGILLAMALLLPSPPHVIAQVRGSQSPEARSRISETVETLYIRGLQSRDFQLIRAACIPDALLMGVSRDGSLGITTLDEWSERFDPANPPFQSLEFEITKIDMVGSAAQVRIDFLIDGERRVTDYLNLLELENGWRIVNIIDHG